MNKKKDELKIIEKELGIDVVTLFKAMKGIFVKDSDANVYYVGSPYLCLSENSKRELEYQFRVVDTWYYVKDFGKTWGIEPDDLSDDRPYLAKSEDKESKLCKLFCCCKRKRK